MRMATGKFAGLSEEEREQIRKVLLRDEQLRSHDRDRLRQLEQEIEAERNKEKAALTDPRFNERICIRCYATLIWLFSPGVRCDICHFKVCKDCIGHVKELSKHMCSSCKKRREYSLKSCSYFFSAASNVRKLINQGVPAILDPLTDSYAKKDVEKLTTDARYYDANAAFYMQFSKAVQDLYDHVDPKLEDLSPTMTALIKTSDLLQNDVVLQSHRLRMVVAARRFTQSLTEIACGLPHKETISSLRMFAAIRRILLEEVYKLLGISVSAEIVANPQVAPTGFDSDEEEMEQEGKAAVVCLEQLVVNCIIDKIIRSLTASKSANSINQNEEESNTRNLNVASLLRSGSLRSLSSKKKKKKMRVSANERRRELAKSIEDLHNDSARGKLKREPEQDSDSEDLAPQFVEVPKSVFATEKEPVQISCKVYSSTETRIGWFRHDSTGQLRELKNDLRFKIFTTTLSNAPNEGHLLQCTLRITSVNASDNCSYVVIAQNEHGQSMHKIKLTMKGMVDNNRHSLALAESIGSRVYNSIRNLQRSSMLFEHDAQSQSNVPKSNLSPLQIKVIDRRNATPPKYSLESDTEDATLAASRPATLLTTTAHDSTDSPKNTAVQPQSPLVVQSPLETENTAQIPQTQQVRLRSGQVVNVTIPTALHQQLVNASADAAVASSNDDASKKTDSAEKPKETSAAEAEAEFSRVRLKKTGNIEKLLAATAKTEVAAPNPAEETDQLLEQPAVDKSKPFHEFQKVKLRGGRMSQLLERAADEDGNLSENCIQPEIDNREQQTVISTPASSSLPKAEATDDLPMTELTNDLPMAELMNDLSITELTNDSPIAELTEDLPTAELTDDLPKAEFTKDLPESVPQSSRNGHQTKPDDLDDLLNANINTEEVTVESQPASKRVARKRISRTLSKVQDAAVNGD